MDSDPGGGQINKNLIKKGVASRLGDSKISSKRKLYEHKSSFIVRPLVVLAFILLVLVL